MAISEELQNTIKRTFELSSTMLDQASILKQKVDSVESDKAVVDLQNRLIRAKARRDRANAEVRAYWAMMHDTCFENAPFDIHGKLCNMESSVQFKVHTPMQWERIWNKVAHRLEVYCSVLSTQCSVNYPQPKGGELCVFASSGELANGNRWTATSGSGSTLCGGLFQAHG